MSAQPLTVLITGAAGAIGYSLIPLFANGLVFGERQPINLNLLEIPQVLDKLNGVKMEVDDGAYPLVQKILCTSDPMEAFAGADYCVLVGGFPRKKGMDRKDLMAKNVPIFRTAGQALQAVGKESAKILVVANPANTNCLVCSHYAPKIPKQNFCALTRLDMNRATSQVANKLGVGSGDVKNVIIWGNHSKTQVPDISHGTASIYGRERSLSSALNRSWARGKSAGGLIHDVQFRGKAVIDARGASSAMSAANAAKDCIRSWHMGTPPGQHVAMAVYSDGSKYGIEEGIFFSFPCVCDGRGNYRIVDSLGVDAELRQLMLASQNELLEERRTAFAVMDPSARSKL